MGNVAYALGQFGVLLLLARLASPDDLGKYALALSITAPIHLGLGLRLRTVRVIEGNAGGCLSTYLWLAAGGACLAIVVSGLLAVILLSDGRSQLILLLVSAGKGVESLIDICYGEAQYRGDMESVARSQILRSGLTLAAAALGAQWGGGAPGAALGIFLASSALSVALLGRVGRAPRARCESGHQHETARLLRLAWPLGLTAVLVSLGAGVPIYMLAILASDKDVATFSLLSYSTVILVLLSNAACQASIGALSRTAKQDEPAMFGALVLRLSAAVVTVGALAVTIASLFGRALLTVSFGDAYAPHVSVGVTLMIAAVLGGLASVAQCSLLSAGSYRTPGVIIAVVLALSIPSASLLTSRYGLSGAAIAVALAMAVQMCLMYAVLAYRFRVMLARGRGKHDSGPASGMRASTWAVAQRVAHDA